MIAYMLSVICFSLQSSFRLQKKVFDRTISELEKKTAAEGSSTNEVLEQLSDLVKERDGITIQ